MVSEPTRDPVTDHLLTPQNCVLAIIDYQPVNSWEEVDFRHAVESTGRKKLVMAALWTEVCFDVPAPRRGARRLRGVPGCRCGRRNVAGRPRCRARAPRSGGCPAGELGAVRVRAPARLGSHANGRRVQADLVRPGGRPARALGATINRGLAGSVVTSTELGNGRGAEVTHFRRAVFTQHVRGA